MASYDENLSSLQTELAGENNKKRLKKLMKATFKGRQEWIKSNESPPISQVLDVFKPLGKFNFVS